MPSFQSSSRAGFTLIELIVTMVVLSIVAVVSIRLLVSAGDLYTTVGASRQASADLGMALDRLLRETRLVSSAGTNPLAADTNVFSFINRDGSNVTFRLSGSDLLLNGNLLLAGARTFALDYYDSTNGLLAPRPLDLGNRQRVRAIGVTLNAAADGRTETLKTCVFWPESGRKL
ncbi:MAG: prepilin-type N-terminal cleavage/methylation domain-containing protein [Verrucomicrobiota bacterium]|nr:prepilin-type N-terminal cleavage/methylation domain-containing protein [Verrucomicrobiota bacterium]